MICKSYQGLSIPEQIEMIGKLVHLVQTSENAFTAASMMIEAGEATGKFNNVKVGFDVFEEALPL